MSYKTLADQLKLMAHPMRLQVLDLLRASDECVCHLSAALDRPQPYMSQQLAVLRNAGLLTDYKQGTNVFYRLASDEVRRRVDAVLGPADGADARHVVVNGCYCPKCSGVSA